MEEQFEEFKDSMGYHYLSVSNALNGDKEWKDLSVREFCETTYGAPSHFTRRYGNEGNHSSSRRLVLGESKGATRQVSFLQKPQTTRVQRKKWMEFIESAAPQ